MDLDFEIECCCGLPCKRVLTIDWNKVIEKQVVIDIDGPDCSGEDTYASITLDKEAVS